MKKHRLIMATLHDRAGRLTHRPQLITGIWLKFGAEARPASSDKTLIC
jgi:hypothetical protein